MADDNDRSEIFTREMCTLDSIVQAHLKAIAKRNDYLFFWLNADPSSFLKNIAAISRLPPKSFHDQETRFLLHSKVNIGALYIHHIFYYKLDDALKGEDRFYEAHPSFASSFFSLETRFSYTCDTAGNGITPVTHKTIVTFQDAITLSFMGPEGPTESEINFKKVYQKLLIHYWLTFHRNLKLDPTEELIDRDFFRIIHPG